MGSIAATAAARRRGTVRLNLGELSALLAALNGGAVNRRDLRSAIHRVQDTRERRAAAVERAQQR